MDMSTPAFIQGIFPFTGSGQETPKPLKGATYAVPGDKRAQMIYFRAGNSSKDLITLVLLSDGKPIRYFPVGGRDAIHVPLAVVEDLPPETKISLDVAAKKGEEGVLAVDIGFVEI